MRSILLACSAFALQGCRAAAAHLAQARGGAHARGGALARSSRVLSRARPSASDASGAKYDARAVEAKWQAYWDEHETFKTVRRPDAPKKYVLDMFPYPSGAGLHVGHPEGYTASDIMARYWRMCGYDVLHPMGWDSFGLPAEQHAVQTGTHPRTTTAANIANFKRQLKSLGFSCAAPRRAEPRRAAPRRTVLRPSRTAPRSRRTDPTRARARRPRGIRRRLGRRYDWGRELATTDIEYVKWTQWIFLQLFQKGLAVQSEARAAERARPSLRHAHRAHVPRQPRPSIAYVFTSHARAPRCVPTTQVPVNWCAGLGTVLANEEVIDGKSERGDFPVVRLPLRQWVLKITECAQLEPFGARAARAGMGVPAAPSRSERSARWLAPWPPRPRAALTRSSSGRAPPRPPPLPALSPLRSRLARPRVRARRLAARRVCDRTAANPRM